jgi:hypothetical protein
VDEGNNWVNVSWGPLSLTNDALAGGPNGNYGGGVLFGDYALTAIPALTIPTSQPHPPTDFFGHARPETNGDSTFDPGAVEFAAGTGTATMSVTPTSLAFGSVADGTTSAAQTVTLNNTGGSTATGIALTFTGPYARPAAAAGGTCGATLAAGASCTINVTFHPTAAGAAPGTLAIAASVAVTGSPVTLTGTGLGPTVTFLPASWTIAHVRNCPGSGLLGILACALDPIQSFTLTNTGTVPVTGVTTGALGGTATNDANYAIVRLLSNCGTTAATRTLAPGASCTITVQFKPLTAQGTGLKAATISVTDLVGTQTSTLNGTAQ